MCNLTEMKTYIDVDLIDYENRLKRLTKSELIRVCLLHKKQKNIIKYVFRDFLTDFNIEEK